MAASSHRIDERTVSMSNLNQASGENKKKTARGKRVNRMKRFIISVAVILLFLSVILNFVLALKVLGLEEKINQLYSHECIVCDDLYV